MSPEEQAKLLHAGSAIAAFALAQIAFASLVKKGLLPKAEAEQLLKEAIDTNRTGGAGNQVAADLLGKLADRLAQFGALRRQ